MARDPLSVAMALLMVVVGVVNVFVWPPAALTCGLAAGFLFGVMAHEKWPA